MPLRVLSICAALSIGVGGALSADAKDKSASAAEQKYACLSHLPTEFWHVDKEAALACLNRQLKADPKSADLHMRKACLFEAWRKPDEAVAEYMLVGVYLNDPYYGYLQSGWALEYSQRFEEALPYFEKALNCPKRQTTLALAYESRGRANQNLGHYDLAILDFRKAASLNPVQRESTTRKLRDIYWKKGDICPALQEAASIYIKRLSVPNYAKTFTASDYKNFRAGSWAKKDFVGVLNLYWQEWTG